MKVGSLVKRKPQFGDWVKHNPWMTTEKDLETGIIIRIGRAGYWDYEVLWHCLLYTSPSPRDRLKSRMPSSA